VINQLLAAPQAAQTPRAAFMLAHPGHELRVYGWLETLRPRVFVLTDGGGPDDKPRINSSLRLITTTGATRGSLFGRLRDRTLYELLLSNPKRSSDIFFDIIHELASELVRAKINIVIGDAIEGFSPSHDIMRELTNVAVHIAQKAGSRIRNFSFVLDGTPTMGRAAQLVLDDQGMARKLAAAQAYPEMSFEVEQAIARFGVDAFRMESLELVEATGPTTPPLPTRYEDFGQARVQGGVYREVITYEQHVRPWVHTLWSITQ
jgi:hypothetical protein